MLNRATDFRVVSDKRAGTNKWVPAGLTANTSSVTHNFHFYTVQEIKTQSQNNQLLALVFFFVFRDKILKHIHTH